MEFIRGDNTEKVCCSLCGVRITADIFPPSFVGLHFNELKTKPNICSKCVAEKLGIKDDWATDTTVKTK